MDIVPAAVKRFVIIAAVVMTAACSGPAEPTRAAAPLSGTFESPEALAREVLRRLASNDLAGLRSLALSEPEFREHVWPQLAVSRPERNVPFEYAWAQMQQRSDGQLQSTFARHAGRPLKFVRTGYAGETTRYMSFAVMRDSEVIAADESGRELVLRLFGSVLVKDGRYKLFSYVVDD